MEFMKLYFHDGIILPVKRKWIFTFSLILFNGGIRENIVKTDVTVTKLKISIYLIYVNEFDDCLY